MKPYLIALFCLGVTGCTDHRTCQPCSVYSRVDGQPSPGYMWDTPPWSMNHGYSRFGGPGCVPCAEAHSPEAITVCKGTKP